VRETSAGTARAPENTRTRLAAEVSSSAAVAAFVSPGQPGRTATNSYDTASGPPVAGDDPVNNSDPSGLYCAGAVGETQCPHPIPGPPAQWPISSQFNQWVQGFEGTCSSTGHWCYVQGQCQIGYGHDSNNEVTPSVGCDAPSIEGFSVPLSQGNQVQLLQQDLGWYEQQTSNDIPAPLTKDQTYALTDFAYNLGTGYWTSYSLTLCGGPCSLYNYLASGGEGNAPSPADSAQIIQLFENYNSGGELANRRYDEAMLYLYGEFTHAPYPGATTTAASCSTSAGSPTLA